MCEMNNFTPIYTFNVGVSLKYRYICHIIVLVVGDHTACDMYMVWFVVYFSYHTLCERHIFLLLFRLLAITQCVRCHIHARA